MITFIITMEKFVDQMFVLFYYLKWGQMYHQIKKNKWSDVKCKLDLNWYLSMIKYIIPRGQWVRL
jgi:hypothetical protein